MQALFSLSACALDLAAAAAAVIAAAAAAAAAAAGHLLAYSYTTHNTLPPLLSLP